MFRKAMVYLGLGDDAEYDAYDTDYDTYDDAEQDQRPAPQRSTQVPQARPVQTSNVSTMPATPSAYPDEPSAIGAVRPMGRTTDPRESSGMGQTINPSSMTSAAARPRPQVVRPIAVHNAKPHLVAPVSFNEAQDVADKFKGSQPVIMNLQGADRELSRRLIDFASGLCYGLGGQMERVANQVYLLTPSNVEVSQEERRRLQDRGYDS